MRLILIGPPGSGKGTQAKLLSERLGLVHFSTGDILRDAVDKDTAEGRLAKTFMSAGQLVPDDVVNEIVKFRFRRSDKPTKFVMDGYPRTLAQARAFDEVLRSQSLGLVAVVYLKVADEEIVRRNSARWTCSNPECRATFNAISRPPKTAGVCDLCHQPLNQRDDDKPETIRKRLQIFHLQNADILSYYQSQGLLREVPGTDDIEAIYRAIAKTLGS